MAEEPCPEVVAARLKPPDDRERLIASHPIDATIASFIEEHRDEVVSAWVDEIHREMPDSSYTRQPLCDLFVALNWGVQRTVMILRTGAYWGACQFIIDPEGYATRLAAKNG